MDRIIKGLETASQKLTHFFDHLLSGLLELIEKTQQWLTATAKKIANYLITFIISLAKLFIALIKVGLFYIPSILFILLSIIYHNIYILALGLFWSFFITLIAITYGNTNKDKH